MKTMMYSIRDAKVGSFMNPFYGASRGAAVRDFTDACSDDKSFLSKHPEDYALYEIGYFDTEKGLCVPAQQPLQVICGLECVSAK